MRSKSLFLASVLAATGCALVSNGTTQTVIIDSRPSGAEVQINGEGPFFRTPYTAKDLPRQEHTLKFKAMKGYKEMDWVLQTRTSGYFYWSLVMGVLAGGIDWLTGAWQEFDLTEEGKVVVPLEPSEENPEGIVRFSTNPPGATIEIDSVSHPGKTGVKSQATPITVIWKDGEREKTVIFRLLGFKDKSVRLRRSDKILDAELIPEATKFRVLFESHPAGAKVLINNEPIGGTTPFAHEFTFEAGDTMPRKIEFRMDRYISDTQHRVSVTDKNVGKVKGLLVAQKETAAVRVDCVPAGAQIDVDGARWGEGPAEVPLVWSVEKTSYKIRISRPGYESQEHTVEEAKKELPQIRLKPALPRLP